MPQEPREIQEFIDVKRVAQMLGMSVPTVWRHTHKGTMPKPIKLTAGVTRWRLSDIRDWIETRAAA